MCYLGSIVARPKLKGIGGGVLQRVTRTVRHKILTDFKLSRTKIELNAGISGVSYITRNSENMLGADNQQERRERWI